jgi:hypothetical protein
MRSPTHGNSFALALYPHSVIPWNTQWSIRDFLSGLICISFGTEKFSRGIGMEHLVYMTLHDMMQVLRNCGSSIL